MLKEADRGDDCLEIGPWRVLAVEPARRSRPRHLPESDESIQPARGPRRGGWPVDDAVVTERMDLAYQVTA